MLDDARVLVAIEHTRLTVVAIQAAGDDPIFATGVLLRDLTDVISRNTPQGMYVRVNPARIRLQRALARLEKLGFDWNEARHDLGLPYAQRTPYPSGHEYRVR